MNAAPTHVSAEPRLQARGRPRTVVIGFDGSACAARGLKRAASLIDEDGLLVLVAVDAEAHSPGLLAAPLIDAEDGNTDRLLRDARQLLAPEPTAFLSVAGRGDPAEVLRDVAREHRADLLVVGRRGRDFAARVLLGSVTSRLIADAPCDVLVVR
jgi:nucleotide-binding universal stress UspA family protein